VRWNALRGEQPMQMYTVLGQGVFDFPLRVLFLRAAGDRAAAARQVAAAVREVAPRVRFADLAPLSRNLERETRPWRLGATVFTAFGALAVLLAALGLYGVVAYDVAQRTAEMGVRLALGARTWDVVRLVVAQGVRVAAVGVAVGTLGALAAGRWVGSLLFDTRPHDPLVLGGVAAGLMVVAVAASLVPAWRATRVAPGVALRAE
jgi:putative ABC transport system permease protein